MRTVLILCALALTLVTAVGCQDDSARNPGTTEIAAGATENHESGSGSAH